MTATATPDGAAVLEGVGKRFGKVQALRNVSVRIRAGQISALVGPDGAGKTTLMRLMAGLLLPDEGTLTVAGLKTTDSALADRTGYMPQRFGLYEDLSVQENMRLYAGLRGVPLRQQAALFERLYGFTRLGPFAARLAGRLSGGMKQKLGLACALMASPQVLLLDEPGVGVDPLSRRDLWQMVQALAGEGMAVVWATSYLEEAENCAEVFFLNGGELVFSGAPQALTQRLQGRTYLLQGNLHDHRGLLAQALDMPGVSDGVIQGSALRLVLRQPQEQEVPHAKTPPSGEPRPASLPEPLEQLAQQAGGVLAPVSSRFEDAFVDLLGGGPGGHSALAAQMPQVRLDDPQHVVVCAHLSKYFGGFAATDDVSFTVRQGEIFGLLGPNGAGKSTTFKMLCGLLRPDGGTARIAGLDFGGAGSQAKMQLGYMAQKFSLYGLLSVWQNLNYAAGMYGLAGKGRRQRVDEMVETFQLQRYLAHSPDELPLGYRQRLALACAVMHNPPVLFLDEPTSGVDPITRREFWMHINALVRRGVTVLTTTHFMDEAEYCDRVALMYQARVIALDTPDALKASAATAGRPDPTMEDAFVRLIERADHADGA